MKRYNLLKTKDHRVYFGIHHRFDRDRQYIPWTYALGGGIHYAKNCMTLIMLDLIVIRFYIEIENYEM